MNIEAAGQTSSPLDPLSRRLTYANHGDANRRKPDMKTTERW